MSTVTKKVNRKQNIPIGNVQFWEKTESGITGKTAEACFFITVYDIHTVRVQVSQEDRFSSNPYSVVITPKQIDFEITDDESHISITTPKIQVRLNLEPFSITFLNAEGEVLNEDDPAFSVSWLGTEVSNYKKIQPKEKFIGLGEKTGNLNRAGKAFTNWNTDYFAYGTEDDPLYMSIPFYIGIHSQRAYGIFLDNSHKSVFNFGASNNRFIYYSAEDGDLDYYFFHEDNVAGIISAYTELTGKMELPPLWSLGYQQCRYSYYPDSEVLNLARTFREKDIPADVIYLDIHHMEKYKVFTFDEEKFPDPKSMIARLREKGFRVVVIMDPGIKSEGGYLPYDEGKENELFVLYPDGEIYEGQVWPGWCAFPDFTKPEARAWWAEKMAFYKNAGVAGYWTDMNEPASWGQFTPNLINFHYEGEEVSHRKARNIYGLQMARSAMEGSLLQDPGERPFILTRSGFSGIQRYAAAWTGDNVASDAHMMAGIRLVNSLGLSGIAFSGYDVGGFCGEASKSLFARWMSIAAFAPLYRAHSMINSNDSEPWSFGEEVEEISRNYIKLRYRLLPTVYSSFYKSSLDGLPIAKSLAVDHPHDDTIYESLFQNQYIFCDSLLIVPVESTVEITKVYLPEGEWYYFYNDQTYGGNQVIYIDTPLNYLPVFVKSGSVLGLQSDISHTGEKNDGILRLHFYQGKSKSTYLHYEDDGHSMNYKNGLVYKREIEWDPIKRTIRFGKAEGDYTSSFQEIQLFFHGTDVEKIRNRDEIWTTAHERVAFLSKLTEFDPLPEFNHPYFDIKAVPNLKMAHFPHEFSLELL